MKIETKLIASERLAILSIALAVMAVAAGAAKPYGKLIGASTGALRNIPDLAESQRQIEKMKQLGSCLSNLREIDMAKERAALENSQTYYGKGASVEPMQEQELSAYLKGGLAAKICPNDGHYVINAFGQEPACSVHGDLPAVETLLQAADEQAQAAMKRADDRLDKQLDEILKQTDISLPTNAATETK